MNVGMIVFRAYFPNVLIKTFHISRRNAYDIDDVAERIFPKRNMDPIDRSGFSSFVKKNMDPIDRSGFSDFVKKNMDPIDRSGFNTFIKRKLQEGFKQMIRNSKKNMDPIDRSGFSDLSKRRPRSATSGCLYSCNFPWGGKSQVSIEDSVNEIPFPFHFLSPFFFCFRIITHRIT